MAKFHARVQEIFIQIPQLEFEIHEIEYLSIFYEWSFFFNQIQYMSILIYYLWEIIFFY